MTIFASPAHGSHGSAGYQIDKSLRFRSSASAYLSRTFGTPTSSTIFTLSLWVKRGGLSGTYRLFGAGTTTYLTFNSSDQLNLTLNGTSAATSSAVFRDPSAHYHIVYQQNGSAQTIYVNNVSVATGTTAAAIFNTAIGHQIGAANTSNYLDGYLSEINFIDGQALTPSSFGEQNADGVWVPKKYTGTYGANGFYLDFKDGTSTTTLGYDKSGNSNNWTSSGHSLTDGATYDWMTDTPTNNYATLNPLSSYSGITLRDGNLTSTYGGAGNVCVLGSIGVSSGKWYWETTVTTLGSGTCVGVTQQLNNLSTLLGTDLYSYGYAYNGYKYNNSLGEAYGTTFTSGDVIGIALDMDSGTLVFYKNNTSQGTAYSSLSGTFFPAMSIAASCVGNVNFGQRSFAYTPPTEFKALCTANIPAGGSITTSGSFTGNANADGPFIWLNGNPSTMTINGNAVTFGTHADKTAGGFKVRTSSASYNASGSNTYSVSVTGNLFGDASHAPNTAKGNP